MDGLNRLNDIMRSLSGPDQEVDVTNLMDLHALETDMAVVLNKQQATLPEGELITGGQIMASGELRIEIKR